MKGSDAWVSVKYMWPSQTTEAAGMSTIKNVGSGEEDIIKNKTVQTFLIRCCFSSVLIFPLGQWNQLYPLSTTLCC